MEAICFSKTSVHGSIFQKMTTFRTSQCRILPSHLLRAGFMIGWLKFLKMEVIYSSETSVHGAISQEMTNAQDLVK
jgi:hypothetical protein